MNVKDGAADMAASNDLSAVSTDGGGHDFAIAVTDLAHALDLATAVDMPVVHDMTDPGIPCGSTTCGVGLSCCVTSNNGSPTYACKTTCGPGTFMESCDGPEDCSSGTCCATMNASMNPPTGSSWCESPTNGCSMANFDLRDETSTTKLCHTPADCTGYMSNLGPATACCAFTGTPGRFCAPATVVGSDPDISCMP